MRGVFDRILDYLRYQEETEKIKTTAFDHILYVKKCFDRELNSRPSQVPILLNLFQYNSIYRIKILLYKQIRS